MEVLCGNELENFTLHLNKNIFLFIRDRTIDRVFPNDPYKNESEWPEGFGELTNVR